MLTNPKVAPKSWEIFSQLVRGRASPWKKCSSMEDHRPRVQKRTKTPCWPPSLFLLAISWWVKGPVRYHSGQETQWLQVQGRELLPQNFKVRFNLQGSQNLIVRIKPTGDGLSMFKPLIFGSRSPAGAEITPVWDPSTSLKNSKKTRLEGAIRYISNQNGSPSRTSAKCRFELLHESNCGLVPCKKEIVWSLRSYQSLITWNATPKNTSCWNVWSRNQRRPHWEGLIRYQDVGDLG